MARKPIAIAAALAILACAFLLAFEPIPERRLAIYDGHGGRLGGIDLPDGRFDFVFIHSVHLTPVIERYELEDSRSPGPARLHLYELRYQSPGVGMPADAEGGYRLEGSFFVLSMDRRYERIPLRVSIVPGHGIVAEGIYYPFRNWAGPNEALVLKGEKVFAIRIRRYKP